MKVHEIIANNEKWISNEKYNEVTPEVTIILPTFRRAQNGFFENAVLSVINQTYKQWELIIVDDASTDGTEQLIQEFMKADSRINCIRHVKNVGLPAISEYEGYRRGRGQYFAFIFDDNVWEKEYLFKTILFMKKKNVKASYGLAKCFANIEKNDYVVLGQPTEFGTQELSMRNFIANGSVLLHKSVLEDVGLYDPHLTLTRLCDWDLWRRICKKYDFVATNISATSEMGACLSDSLGNSYVMNIWCALERMEEERDAMLRPEAYEDVNIDEISVKNTEYYCDFLQILKTKFEGKFWYPQMEISKKKWDFSKSKKRILLVHDGMTASVTLYWERLFKQSEDFIVKYHYGTVNKNELLFVDAVIVCRAMLTNEYLPEWCNTLKIPCYYFVDDNFIELAKEFHTNTDVLRVSKVTNRTILKRFNAVFVSTPSLKKYYEDHLLHKRVLLLEPLLDVKATNDVKLNVHQEELNICFLGGKWREETFKEYVLPALKRLSKQKKITLVVPLLPTDQMSQELYNDVSDETLRVEFLERTLSLTEVLSSAKKKNIDILVHCGDATVNNEFKTENALLNALQIGAVLVTSNESPYAESLVKDEAFLMANNTVNGWYEVLEELCNVNLRKSLFESMKEYCFSRYIFEKCAVDFLNELAKYKISNYYEYLERAEILLMASASPNITGGERAFHNMRLGIGTLIDKSVSYNITCTVRVLREIGILFGSFDLSCGGRIKVSITDGKNSLFEKWFPMSYFVRDDWTYIEVGGISGMQGKVITLNFECEYEPGSAKVGFFENLDKRTFWYKVCNKLGHHIKGLDAIITECR